MKLTRRDRGLLAVAAALAVCAAFYVLVIIPQRHEASRLQTQIAAVNTTLARAQQRVAQGRAAESALKASQLDWNAAEQAVPQTADVPALLKVLARSARAAHVSMQSISLAAAATSAASTPAASTPAASTTAGTSAGATATIPVSLTFNGGYQALNRLVDRLDALVTTSRRSISSRGPLIGIGAINVAPMSSSGRSSALSIQLTATIYQRAATGASSTGVTG
ncbi:MAG TPA: type II secretion system protein GspM [Solirubrobacteraceae bacterium]|nr:type II secretion system protein GspM [Solirubrobacteraceae bacterium]